MWTCNTHTLRLYGEIWFRDAYQFLFFDVFVFFSLETRRFLKWHTTDWIWKGDFITSAFFSLLFYFCLFYEIFYQFHAIKLVWTQIKKKKIQNETKKRIHQKFEIFQREHSKVFLTSEASETLKHCRKVSFFLLIDWTFFNQSIYERTFCHHTSIKL